MELAHDPHFLGAQIGLLGVLQTWTRKMCYHPHVHYLVPGGGRADDGCTWVTARADFLVHVKPLAARVEGQAARCTAPDRTLERDSRSSLAAELGGRLPECRDRTLRASSLAPYIFRVALSNNRIVQLADEKVTFRYTVSESGRTAYCTLPVQEFLRRFLQHILPKGFVKVRYYGLFRLGMRRSLARLRSQLLLLQHIAASVPPAPAASDGSMRVVICPSCGQPMQLERVLLPHPRGPPGWVEPYRGLGLGMGRCRLRCRPFRMPALVRLSTVVTTTRICTKGCAQGSPVLMCARAYSASIHDRRVSGHGRPQTTSGQGLSSHGPTPTPDEIPYIMIRGALRPRSTRIMWRLHAT
jgi:hypothetical protein